MKSGQIIQFPLSRGLAEDDNAKNKPLASLKSGVNIRWPKAGVVGKRFGTEEISTGVSDPKRFVARGPELSLVDGTTLKTLGADDTWSGSQRVPEAMLTWQTIMDDNTGVASADVALSGDYVILVWVTGDPTCRPENALRPEDAGTTFLQIQHRVTGDMVYGPVLVGTDVVHARIVVVGGYAIAIYVNMSGEIRTHSVNLTTFATAATQTLLLDSRTDSSHRGRIDAILLSSGKVLIAYEITGTNVLRLARYSHSAGSLSVDTSASLTDGIITAISLVEDTTAGRVYVLYGHRYNSPHSFRVRLRAVNSSLADVLSPVTIQNDYHAQRVTAKLISTGSILCGWAGVDQATVGTAAPSFETGVFDNAGTEATKHRRSAAVGILSQVFTMGARYYVVASDWAYNHENFLSGTDIERIPSMSSYLLEVETSSHGLSADFPPHRYAGKIDHDISGIFQFGLVPAVPAVDSNTVLALVPFLATAAQAPFNWRCGLRLVAATVDADDMPDPWASSTVGQETYIVGSFLQAWDGRTTFDVSMRAPQGSMVSAANANGGGLLQVGTYIYQFGSSYRSGAGVLHRGPLSVQLSEDVSSANSSMEWLLSPQSIDCKQTTATGFALESAGEVMRDVYRSEANGSVVYELSWAPRWNTFPNDPTSLLNTYIDLRDDAQIIDGAAYEISTRPQPYTSSGELEDVQPPASYTRLFHLGRLFIVTGGRREIWYAKDVKENPGIAPGFSQDMRELYEQDITALASMDEKRIVFWERGIWYVVGDGPTVAGTDNRFSSPQVIQSDVGCTNPRSVVSTPMGVLFQSDENLYLLTRGLTVDWIGKDAQDTVAAYPLITSAVLVAHEGEVRFTCNTSDGTEGVMLVFDYTRGTWTTRDYGGASLRDAILHDGDYYFATDADVFRELTTTHLDSGSFVASTVELESIVPSGPIGWQRVRIAKLLGQSLSNHGMTVSIGRDFATTYEQSETFAAGSSPTATGAHARCEVLLTVQRRQAVQLKFTDAAPSNTTLYPLGNGAGFQFEGVALLVVPKDGLPRDTSTRRGG